MMVDYSNIPRDSRRVPLETRVQFKFDRFSGFLSEYSANVSPGGLFLRTRAPQAPGTVLDFEFRLGDGFELIKGRGEVVWVRSEDEGPARPAGMGIRFLELAPGSKELIYRIVDQHILQGGTPFDVTQRPPDSALPPLAAAFAASLGSPGAPSAAPVAPSALTPAEDIFDLSPVPAPAPMREPEPLPDATSWLPSIDDPALEPLPPPYSSPQSSSRPAPSPEPFPDLFAPPEPAAPAPVPAAPMFATTFGAASARQPRRVLPWILLAAGVILAAAVFLMRDTLMGMVGLGDGEEVVQTAPPPRPRRPAPVVPAPAAPETSEATPEVTLDPTAPALSETTPEPTPQPAPEATPAPTPPPSPRAVEPIPAVAEDAGPAITRLENITFKQAGGGTEIILQGDGAIRAESFTRTRIDGNPPRELIRLSGIRRQFSKPRVVVGTPEVLQVRVGYHPEMGRGELHVVLDLARPNVVVAGVEPGENQLRIRLQRK